MKVIHGGVGTINESDVSLAAASNAIIIGFNVRVDSMAKSTADREHVDVRLYRVIYQAIEDVEAAMKGMLDPIFEEQRPRPCCGSSDLQGIRQSERLQVPIVLDGKFVREAAAAASRRDGEQLYDGPLVSLKRFKDDVKEVQAGLRVWSCV